jgi:hypothetical protein
MSIGVQKFTTNDLVAQTAPVWLTLEKAGDVTADLSADFLAPFDGRFNTIEDIFMQMDERGIDATDALRFDLDVLVDGTSIFTTKPSIAAAAGGGAAITLAAATGIVVGVLKTTSAVQFSKGDVITITIDETSTTPDTEGADARVMVGLTKHQDADPDMTVARTA